VIEYWDFNEMVYNHTVVCEEFLLYQDKVNKLIKAGIDEID